MNIHRCNFSVSIDDARLIWRRYFPTVVASLEGTLLSGMTSPDVRFEDGLVVLMAKKKVLFLGETAVSVVVRVSAGADGRTVRAVPEKVGAGPIATGFAIKHVMAALGRKIADVSGLKVDGDAVMVDVGEVLSGMGIALDGRISSVEVLADKIEMAVV